MKFALCNEFCEGWPIEAVFRLAAEAGYGGVEIAPFTLAESVREISAHDRHQMRMKAEAAGVEIVGLHWLLVSPEGLNVNHPDDRTRWRTQDYFMDLIHFCADLGGRVMTFGSPDQRSVQPGEAPEGAWERTVGFFQNVLDLAAEREVVVGMEPLPRAQTNFVNTKDEAVRLVDAIDHPNFRLTLDCKAMTAEATPAPRLIREAADMLVHCHANDDNGRYPGTGGIDFPPILRALLDIDYDGWLSLEVFDFSPDPETIAREAIAHLRACLERAQEM